MHLPQYLYWYPSTEGQGREVKKGLPGHALLILLVTISPDTFSPLPVELVPWVHKTTGSPALWDCFDFSLSLILYHTLGMSGVSETSQTSFYIFHLRESRKEVVSR